MRKGKPKLGSIYLRGHIYWVKYYRDGQPFRESSRSERYAEAERLLKLRNGEIVTGKFCGLGPERIRMMDLFNDVMEDYRLNRRSSIVQLESRLKTHLVPAFGETRAADFTTHLVRRYRAKRLEAGAALATVNRELEIIERSFKLAAECDPPKVARVVHIPMLQENNVRTGFLDDAGYIRLRSELPEYLRPLFVVAYHVGSRLGELQRLKWPQVDFENCQIVLRPGTTKNKSGRVLPIYGDMREWLLMAKDISNARFPNCTYVFNHDGNAIVDFRKAWKSACARAHVHDLLFHDLRRSAVRNMRLAGIPENVAMKISGHRTRAVFDRYNIVSPRDLKDAAEKLEHRLNASLGTILGTISPAAPNGTDINASKSQAKVLN
jgi:integrase